MRKISILLKTRVVDYLEHDSMSILRKGWDFGYTFSSFLGNRMSSRILRPIQQKVRCFKKAYEN